MHSYSKKIYEIIQVHFLKLHNKLLIVWPTLKKVNVFFFSCFQKYFEFSLQIQGKKKEWCEIFIYKSFIPKINTLFK
jgi:hypothetical protein